MAFSVETSTSSNVDSNAIGSTLTISFTVTSANMLVVIFTGDGQGGSLVTGVTYNTIAMTLSKASSNNKVKIYTLANPATGTHNVVVSFNAATGEASVGVISFISAATSIGASASGGTTPISANVSQAITTTVNNSFIVGGVFLDRSVTIASAAGFTQISQFRDGTDTRDLNSEYKQIASAGASSMSWSNSSNAGGNYEIAIVEIYGITTFVKTAAVSVSNASSRLATLARIATYNKTASATVSNAASRFATAVGYRFHIFTASASAVVSNAASRFAQLFRSDIFHFDRRSSAATFTNDNKTSDTFTADSRSATSNFTNDTKSNP